MNLKNKSINIGYIAVFLFLSGIAALLIHRNYEQKKERYYARLIGELKTAYDVITLSNSESAQIAFSSQINQPEILDLFKQARSADENRRDSIRQNLYEKLSPLYERLTLRDVRQLHFHLPDCESFLRFHRPTKYGDNLKGVRYSVEKANADLVRVTGFEEGRIFNGFRNVFPLIYEGEHLGSVEVSMEFDAIRKRMEQQFPQSL
ncbi:diguanylate cyclase (GGDEF domain) [Chloroherpeton thalassium ATCC 35110]|uniref:Diguanylate cyclase (GGDEF domain) n=1 Tax=Chloroherpeton thalassium (strain ATCC 35110 / GB-78) TaxID=517418 RepID=B3QWM4_CHLT3|nr:diguanylate cyclase (GGDEF domain) [Chloroherpeton thalassium ATCC 35110]